MHKEVEVRRNAASNLPAFFLLFKGVKELDFENYYSLLSKDDDERTRELTAAGLHEAI
jgi:hypothetical protein